MHIMEGFLPPLHAALWTAAAAPFVIAGARRAQVILRDHPQARMMLGASGAFAFVLSALKLPSVTGSCSHPTGTGLGAVLFGPSVMGLLGAIVLLFQALLLAHGGVTTLGANVFSMAVVGPWVSWAVFRGGRGVGLSLPLAVFLSAALGDVATYVTTALQLAAAFPDPSSSSWSLGVAASAGKFLSVFALTQLPLAVVEGLLTAAVMNWLRRHSPADVATLAEVTGVAWMTGETGEAATPRSSVAPEETVGG